METGATPVLRAFGFLGSLIQGVFAFERAIRVEWTGGTGQAGDAGGFGSATLTVNSFSARQHNRLLSARRRPRLKSFPPPIPLPP